MKLFSGRAERQERRKRAMKDRKLEREERCFQYRISDSSGNFASSEWQSLPTQADYERKFRAHGMDNRYDFRILIRANSSAEWVALELPPLDPPASEQVHLLGLSETTRVTPRMASPSAKQVEDLIEQEDERFRRGMTQSSTIANLQQYADLEQALAQYAVLEQELLREDNVLAFLKEVHQKLVWAADELEEQLNEYRPFLEQRGPAGILGFDQTIEGYLLECEKLSAVISSYQIQLRTHREGTNKWAIRDRAAHLLQHHVENKQ